ncbi:MAG TPA: hypothetical protein PKD86_01615 [Gemmatales bacterium]|nr:hypothetical protein [Gemmatales bacterium]HMP58024.1 hypothetical protein [Gemmatales bacterium]
MNITATRLMAIALLPLLLAAGCLHKHQAAPVFVPAPGPGHAPAPGCTNCGPKPAAPPGYVAPRAMPPMSAVPLPPASDPISGTARLAPERSV